jgi:hypothetical protein
MRGLGDNIYQRSFLKVLSEKSICVLDTPFPEIYEDLTNVYFEPCQTELRTQKKNVKKTDFCGRRASELPFIHASTRRGRVQRSRSGGNIRYRDKGIIKGMREIFKFEPARMDLPSFQPTKRLQEILTKKYAVVRPCTIRKEWHSSSRNPKPEYISQAVKILKEHGFATVSIADVDGTNETFVGEKPACDYEFNAGELRVKEILCLVQHASFAVGGVGWLAPACMAYETNSCIIGGGWGTFNHPDRLLPEYKMKTIEFLLPDKFCMCKSSKHDCNKEIKNFNNKFGGILCKLTQNLKQTA